MSRVRRVTRSTGTLVLLTGVLLQSGPVAPRVSSAPMAAPVVVRVPKVAVTGRASLRSPRAVESGDYVWMDMGEEELRALDVSGVPYQVRPEAALVQLAGRTFQSWAEPGIEAEALRSTDQLPGLFIVQLKGPLQPRWMGEILGTDLELVTPLAPYNLIVWGPRTAVTRAAASSFVRWCGPFRPEDKLPERLLQRRAKDGRLSVTVYRSGFEDRTLDALLELLGPFQELTSERTIRVLAPFPTARVEAVLRTVAALPDVLALGQVPWRGSVRDEMSNQIVADDAPGGQPEPGYPGFSLSKGLDGSGVIVGVVDEGSQVDHPELEHGGVMCLDYHEGVPAPACGSPPPSPCTNHGTQTAGIVLADGSSGVGFRFPTPDGPLFLKGLGVAPGARLLSQNFLCTGDFGATPPEGPLDWLHLSQDQVLHGAYISANSWGPAGTPQGYDADTRQFDRMPRDGDPETTDVAEPVVFVLSIMNGNGNTSTQGTPDEGKNLIRVGATRNRIAGSVDDLCYCTAHGPALDGRRLPDLVAPGQSIHSTNPNNGHTGFGLTGTSFASPHVSGAAALIVQEFLANPELGYRPSPALIKAILVATADDLFGGKDADGVALGHRPDDKQGWGRMNLERAVHPKIRTLYFDQSPERTFTASGQDFRWEVVAEDPNQEMLISLVWTDAPGPGLGGASAAWVNDLDLRVEGANTYLGNVFSGGWSATGGTSDTKNNIENVFIQTPGAGSWEITIEATSILGDGVYAGAPSLNAADFDQDFAVVCQNCRIAGPDFRVEAPDIGLQATIPGSGTLPLQATVEVLAKDGYVGNVHLSIPNLPAGVIAQFQPETVVAPGNSLLQLFVSPQAEPCLNALAIQGDDGSLLHADLLGLRLLQDPTGTPTSTPTPPSPTATPTSTCSPTASPTPAPVPATPRGAPTLLLFTLILTPVAIARHFRREFE